MSDKPVLFAIGDRVRCKDDSALGKVIDAGYSAVRVEWDDGLISTHYAEIEREASEGTIEPWPSAHNVTAR